MWRCLSAKCDNSHCNAHNRLFPSIDCSQNKDTAATHILRTNTSRRCQKTKWKNTESFDISWMYSTHYVLTEQRKKNLKFQIEWKFGRCTPTNISKPKTQKNWHKDSENNLPLEQVSVELKRYSWRRSHLCGPKRSLEVRRTQSNKRKMLQNPYHAYWRVLVCVCDWKCYRMLSVVTPTKKKFIVACPRYAVYVIHGHG